MLEARNVPFLIIALYKLSIVFDVFGFEPDVILTMFVKVFFYHQG